METVDWIIVIIAGIVGGGLAPYLVNWVHKKGWIKLDGKSYEEYHSDNDSKDN